MSSLTRAGTFESFLSFYLSGSRDGAVVRALASHQCDPGSIPGLGAICGLSLLLVLVPAPRVFLWKVRYSSLLKIKISKFQIDLETVERIATRWIPLNFPFILFHFIIYFIFFF